jgi:predicted aldo/keto reductase-like oxidoreductase
MKEEKKFFSLTRRKFNKLLMTSIIGGPFIVGPIKGENLIHRNERPSMTYQKLGRTNFMSSRLVFGCGAALVGGKAVRLLDRAFEAGINHFDVGSDVAYKGSEQHLASFMKTNRDNIWVASKAPVYFRAKETDTEISVKQAKEAATMWTQLLNASLKDLKTEYIDAYYLMAVNDPELVSKEELYQAFLDAKSAGKVGYFGLSTHNNAKKVLEEAIKTSWYDLAMIGITPAGWYDWDTKEIEKDTPTLIDLQPLLKQAKYAGIGLIGMKAVRYLAPMSSLGKGDPSAFDEIYGNKFQSSTLNAYQRAYVYVLEHGIDVMNSDMQNFQHLEENIKAVV